MNYLIYIVALVSLSQASVIIKWSQTEPLILGSWRLLFASIFLRAFYQLTKKSTDHYYRISNHQWKIIIATGFLFFLHLYSYAFSVHRIPIAHAMLIYSCNPIFTSMGNLIFFRERITKYHLSSFAICFLGIYFLIFNKFDNTEVNLAGEIGVLIAAITFSAYSLLSKHVRRQLPNSLVTSSFYAVASIFFFISTYFFIGNPIPSTDNSWIGIILLAVFPTILGHSSYTYCMNYIDIQVLSLGKLVEPILSAISAFIVFGEPISIQHGISFICIAVGISIIILHTKQKAVKSTQP